MPQSHPTTGPVRFLSPVQFLARKAEWRASRNLRRCCSRGHIRLWARTAWHSCTLMVWSNDSKGIPCDAREPSMFFILYGTRTGPVQDPQGCCTTPLRTRKGIDTTRIDKNPARASYLAVRGPHWLFTGCLGCQNPYGARKLIIYALNPTAPVRRGKIRTAPHEASAGPVSGRTIFVQNSPGTARTGPGSVMWLGH